MTNFRDAPLVGTKNGSNKAFTIPFTFKGDPVVWKSNVLSSQVSSGAAEGEHTVSGSTVTFGVAPESGDTLVVFALEA